MKLFTCADGKNLNKEFGDTFGAWTEDYNEKFSTENIKLFSFEVTDEQLVPTEEWEDDFYPYNVKANETIEFVDVEEENHRKHIEELMEVIDEQDGIISLFIMRDWKDNDINFFVDEYGSLQFPTKEDCLNSIERAKKMGYDKWLFEGEEPEIIGFEN